MIKKWKQLLSAKKADALSDRILSVAKGQLVPITSVSDPVFSERLMGDGFAVMPQEGAIYAPVTGRVMTVFPTKHAYGIVTPAGLEVLVHIGVDTVELGETAFSSDIVAGQEVVAGQLLAQVDLPVLEAAQKDSTVMVVFTNSQDIADMRLADAGAVAAKAEVGQVRLKVTL